MSVLDLSKRRDHRRASRSASEPEGVTVRPDGARGLRHVRGGQRSLRRRHDDAEGRRADEDCGAAAVDRLHEGRRRRIRDRRERGDGHRDRHGEARRRQARSCCPRATGRRRRGRWARCCRPMARMSMSRSAAPRAVAVHRRGDEEAHATIENVGDRPWGIDVGSDGTKVYTANGPSADVTVIDLASGTVERRSHRRQPWGIVYQVEVDWICSQASTIDSIDNVVSARLVGPRRARVHAAVDPDGLAGHELGLGARQVTRRRGRCRRAGRRDRAA